MRFMTIALCAFLLILSGHASAKSSAGIIESPEAYETLARDAKDAVAAFATNNEVNALKYSYPRAVELSGGKDAFIESMHKTEKKLTENNIRIVSAVVGEPGPIFKAGKEWHSIVPQVMMMSIGGELTDVEAHLLAISSDEGKNWTFMDTIPLSLPRIRKEVFPDFNENLRIPKIEESEEVMEAVQKAATKDKKAK